MDIDTDPPSSSLPTYPLSSVLEADNEIQLPLLKVDDLDKTPTRPITTYQGVVEPSSDPIAIGSQRGHISLTSARALG